MQVQMSVTITVQKQSAILYHLKNDPVSPAVCISWLSLFVNASHISWQLGWPLINERWVHRGQNNLFNALFSEGNYDHKLLTDHLLCQVKPRPVLGISFTAVNYWRWILVWLWNYTNQDFVLQVLFLYAVGKDKIEWSKKWKQVFQFLLGKTVN